MRVSGACAAFLHDSLSIVNVPRRCCRPGCPHYAVATLTFVYSDSTAVVGPLATAREPHSWDLCVGHAGRITAPRGWDLVRHAGRKAAFELLATGETARKRTDETRGGLTAQETQIAQLASEGFSNPEIGAQLFLSPRTVEWHLHKVFEKLGINSRKELKRALAPA